MNLFTESKARTKQEVRLLIYPEVPKKPKLVSCRKLSFNVPNCIYITGYIHITDLASPARLLPTSAMN